MDISHCGHRQRKRATPSPIPSGSPQKFKLLSRIVIATCLKYFPFNFQVHNRRLASAPTKPLYAQAIVAICKDFCRGQLSIVVKTRRNCQSENTALFRRTFNGGKLNFLPGTAYTLFSLTNTSPRVKGTWRLQYD